MIRWATLPPRARPRPSASRAGARCLSGSPCCQDARSWKAVFSALLVAFHRCAAAARALIETGLVLLRGTSAVVRDDDRLKNRFWTQKRLRAIPREIQSECSDAKEQRAGNRYCNDSRRVFHGLPLECELLSEKRIRVLASLVRPDDGASFQAGLAFHGVRLLSGLSESGRSRHCDVIRRLPLIARNRRETHQTDFTRRTHPAAIAGGEIVGRYAVALPRDGRPVGVLVGRRSERSV